MRTEVAIYLPAGCTPESRRGFWWKQKRTCPATPGWIRCRSTTLAEARTEAPVWLIHQAPQRGAPVLPPAELNFTSTLPPACEMLPEFAALNIESRKSKSRGKWTAVLASTVRGWLFRIMVGGVRRCGHHPVSDHPRNPLPQFHLPKVCDETLADFIRFAVAGRTHGMSTPLIISKFKRGSFQRFPSFKLLLCRQSWMDSAYHLTCGRRHPDVRDLRESCITALRKPTEANLINSISQSCCIRNVWRARRKRAGEKPEIFP